MDTTGCHVAAWVAVSCVFIILILLIHHKLDHSDRVNNPRHYIEDPCEQWFQYKLYPHGDVCNWTTCSHEMWILGLVVVIVVAGLIVVFNDWCVVV